MPTLSKKPTQTVLGIALEGAFKTVMINGDSNSRDAALEVAKRWEYIATVTCKGEDIPTNIDFVKVSQNPDYHKWLKSQDERDAVISIMREELALSRNQIENLKITNKEVQDKLDRAMERLVRLETK